MNLLFKQVFNDDFETKTKIILYSNFSLVISFIAFFWSFTKSCVFSLVTISESLFY